MSLSVALLNDAFPPQIDGVATAVANYGRYLTAHGHKAVAAVPFVPHADDSVFPFPVIRYPSIETSKLVGYRTGLPFDANAVRQLKEGKPDLLHSHCPFTSQMLARTLRTRALERESDKRKGVMAALSLFSSIVGGALVWLFKHIFGGGN